MRKLATSTMGASTVKYTTPLPCISISESVSKSYTNFEFFEGKNHEHFKNTLIYKAKQKMLTSVFSRKVYIFLKTEEVVCK